MKTFTDEQKAAAYTIGAHLCVDAGAGSGKTTVLVERILHLLDRGADLHRIVAITFTRKAAGEMKERLREAIHRRPENDPRSMDKWRALELEVDTARITTIDGFCAALLHENALRIGLDPDFSTLGDEEAPLLRVEIAETTLIAALDAEDAAAHRLVVEHGLDKVKSFLSEMLNQASRFEDAARSYAGLDAAGLAELWKTQSEDLQKLRYESLAHSPEVHRITATLDALAAECSDENDKRETVRRDALRYLAMLREAGNVQRVREGLAGLATLGFKGGRPKSWSSEDAMKAVMIAGKEAKELAEEFAEPITTPEIEAASARLTLDLIALFADTAKNYRDAKEARTALDFGDLLALSVRALHDRPELRARIAAGISHLLIDEFQDTNQAQLDLAKLLSAEGSAELFVVGDAKQSVYRFRGAQVEVFAQAKQLTHETLRLDENFRSIAPLIEFINDFFGQSRLLARVEPEFHRLAAHRKDAPPGPCVEFLVSDPEAEPEDDQDAAPAHGHQREAELVAGRIAQLCGHGGAQVWDKPSAAWRPARFGDVAILYRAGTHAEIYEAALRNRGIPANVIAGSGFFARQEILDLHNLFTAALDPWNEPALAAFLRSPLAGVSDDTLMRLTRGSTLATAFWGAAPTGDTSEDELLSRARALLTRIEARREWPVAALLRELLADTGFEAVLLAQYHGAQKAGNVHKLIDLARNFGGAGRLGLHAFAQHLSALARNGLRAGDAELLADADGAVTLMNVHKAKGLEFPIVVIADTGRPERAGKQAPLCLVDPRRGLAVPTHDPRGATAWPAFGQHLLRLDQEDDHAEEARVLYVAMTRARDRLLLAGPAQARSNTWMAALNHVFALADHDHGATIRGAAWEAIVVRLAPESPGKSLRPDTPELPTLDSLLEQTLPLPTRAAPGQVISVGTVLDLIHAAPAILPSSAAQNTEALDRATLGTAAHTLLERWDFATEPPITEMTHECFPDSKHRDAAHRALSQIVTRLQQSALWPMLAPAKSARRELPFLFDHAGIFLNGKIDALLQDGTLLDYKLGAPAPGRTARHETQLRLYAAAIRAATTHAPRQAFLYYMDSGDLRPVDVSDATLDTTLQRATAAIHQSMPARPPDEIPSVP